MTLNETIAYFEDMQKKIIHKDAELQKMMAEYRAELKAKFGITDGDKMNVLDVIKAMVLIKEQA